MKERTGAPAESGGPDRPNALKSQRFQKSVESKKGLT
ncbi:MAG: hypothetical protein ACJAQ3_003604, partial [Planctomycetota bacterium]